MAKGNLPKNLFVNVLVKLTRGLINTQRTWKVSASSGSSNIKASSHWHTEKKSFDVLRSFFTFVAQIELFFVTFFFLTVRHKYFSWISKFSYFLLLSGNKSKRIIWQVTFCVMLCDLKGILLNKLLLLRDSFDCIAKCP